MGEPSDAGGKPWLTLSEAAARSVRRWRARFLWFGAAGFLPGKATVASGWFSYRMSQWLSLRRPPDRP